MTSSRSHILTHAPARRTGRKARATGRWLAALLVMTSVIAPRLLSASDTPRMTPALQQAFEAIRAAYVAGDSAELWQSLANTVDRVRDPQVQELDRALAAEDIPTVEELLVEARLNLVQQGLADALAEPGIRERLLVLAGLDQRIAATLEQVADDPLLSADPAPTDDLERLERELWDLHVLKNRLLVAERCAGDSVRLARGVADPTFEQLEPSNKAIVALGRVPDFEAIQRARWNILEAELARRLQRLETGVEILRDATFRRERFLAAYSTQLDARILTAFFEERAGQPNHPPLAQKSLGDPEAAGRVADLGAAAEQLAGDLAERSRLFFEGLHWWLRGRYGAGPDLGGLAKSAAALREPGALWWLYMPAEPPTPTNPADPTTPDIPACDRRHHFTWAWEDRRVQERAAYSVKTTSRQVRRELPGFW